MEAARTSNGGGGTPMVEMGQCALEKGDSPIGEWEGWPSYLRHELCTQLRAVGPVSAFLFLVSFYLLGHLPRGTVGILLALGAVALGLQSFMFGLFHGLLPLGDRVGTEMPHHLSLIPILLIAFGMGVLVTYAEPALGVVQTLGAFIMKEEAPYLVYLLSGSGQSWLTLAVAIGVGLAVVVGLLRIHHDNRLAPIIFGLVFVTISLTLYVDMCTDKREVVALAWDLGAITTGPVTVPMVLAIGMGLTKGMGREPTPDQSFGVVTLASLMPVNTVLLFALGLNKASIASAQGPVPIEKNTFGIRDVVEDAFGATQAVVPLICFVFLILRTLLRQPISGHAIEVRRTDHSAEHMQHEAELHPDTVRSPNRGPKPFVSGNMSLCWVWLGLVLFAIGMRYGLNELGDRVGAVIPATFRKLPSLPGSPFYSHGVGVVLSFATAFIMGFGATLAEPALQAMAVTVEELTHDGLSVNQVVLSVAVGVGTGLGLGVLKLIYHIPLAPLLYLLYGLGLALTAMSDDTIVSIAWDSGGVTTDAITVPMVLSLGLGFGGALRYPNSFGLLALASICPIISVLICALLFQTKKHPLAD